ncbi:MAG: lipoate--protein ligase family protein [Thermoplasmatales archaeon]|nr:lipoate--protein ligase family protein [Thermoplasmatales archaeon]
MSTRYVYAGDVGPFRGACAETAVLESVAAGGPDTLLVYSRDRPTVSIGAYADPDDCLRMDYVKNNDVTVLRRISGGSAIYTDPGQLTYCYVRPRTGETIEEGYARVCGYVALGLSKLGIAAAHKPINDVVSGGMKVSGGAQYRDAAVTLQHGSVIITLDRPAVEGALKPLKKPGAALSSLGEILGRVPGKREVADALASGFPDAFEGGLTEKELARVEKCLRLSFSSCSCR